jgi:hypothetical protein
MFVFDDIPQVITQQSVHASQHIWQAVQGQGLAQKALEALAGWFVGFSATQLKARLDDRDRRTQRLRLVGEAADVLRLRDQLRAMADTAGNWEVVARLTPHLDEFAQQNLFKVEQQLVALSAGKRLINPRTLLERIFLVFPPRQRWLWIIHTLFFASLSSALTIFVSIVAQLRLGQTGWWETIFDARLSLLGVLLSAGFFNALGNYFDSRLEAASASSVEGDEAEVRRSWWTRLLLLFAPHNGWMWTGHILFYGYMGLALRFLPKLFKDAGAFEVVMWVLAIVFIVLPPVVTFNLLSNFGDLKQCQEAADGHEAVAEALHRNIFKRMFLLYLPRRWWMGPMHLLYYFDLLVIGFGVLLTLISLASDPSTAGAFMVLTIVWLLPTGVVGLFANLVDGICILLKRRRAVAASQVCDTQILQAS